MYWFLFLIVCNSLSCEQTLIGSYRTYDDCAAAMDAREVESGQGLICITAVDEE